jgi:hypothetical protein
MNWNIKRPFCLSQITNTVLRNLLWKFCILNNMVWNGNLYIPSEFFIVYGINLHDYLFLQLAANMYLQFQSPLKELGGFKLLEVLWKHKFIHKYARRIGNKKNDTAKYFAFILPQIHLGFKSYATKKFVHLFFCSNLRKYIASRYENSLRCFSFFEKN